MNGSHSPMAESGLSQRKFCEVQGLSYVGYWYELFYRSQGCYCPSSSNSPSISLSFPYQSQSVTLSAKHILAPAKRYKPSPQVLGSSRFASGGIDSEGRYIRQQTIVEATPEQFEGPTPAPSNFQGQNHVLQRGLKSYELTNHLGNVMATVSDRKRQSALSITALPIELGNECFPSIIGPLLPASAKFFLPDVRSVQDYEPFGSPMPGRQFNNTEYRYGMNGQEKTDEISGAGNHTTAQFWEYDTRLGRRWNQDPKPNASISNYAAFANNPIWYSDPLGDTISFNFLKFDKSTILQRADHDIVKNQVNDGVFAVFAHGSPGHISVIVDGKKYRANTAEEFNKALSHNKAWSDAMKNKEKVTLLIYACNTASNTQYDQHFGQGLIETKKTISQDISEFLSALNPDSEVKALDGYGMFGEKDGKVQFMGVQQSVTKEVPNNMNGGIVTLKAGEKVKKKPFAFNGSTKPKKGDDAKIKP